MWEPRHNAITTGVMMLPFPVRMPLAKRPSTKNDRAKQSEKAYSPASVEKRFPPSMVKEESKRNGSVEMANALGSGARSRNILPNP